ncbi:MAG: HepT-like ribonuclease domain-containing protein [Candidatus Contendobacter sp.]
MIAQLFRKFALDILAEPADTMPVIDIINLLERYGFIPSAARWQEIRQMRNLIAHEYVLNPEELVAVMEIAFVMVKEMSAVVNHIRRASLIPDT